MRSVTVQFRGEPTDVLVDRYECDPETNGCEVEWRFDGMTIDEGNDLKVSPEEEESIIEQIIAGADGHDDDILEDESRAESRGR